jgi:hypothetical protein
MNLMGTNLFSVPMNSQLIQIHSLSSRIQLGLLGKNREADHLLVAMRSGCLH